MKVISVSEHDPINESRSEQLRLQVPWVELDSTDRVDEALVTPW